MTPGHLFTFLAAASVLWLIARARENRGGFLRETACRFLSLLPAEKAFLLLFVTALCIRGGSKTNAKSTNRPAGRDRSMAWHSKAGNEGKTDPQNLIFALSRRRLPTETANFIRRSGMHGDAPDRARHRPQASPKVLDGTSFEARNGVRAFSLPENKAKGKI